MAGLHDLIEALNSVPDAAQPHVVAQVPARELAPGRRLKLASGAWVELGPAHELPTVDALRAAVLGRWGGAICSDTYDEYVFTSAEATAVEIRAMAGISVLWAVLLSADRSAQLLCVQHDAARWQAEEADVLGPEFTDFAERNATWAGLGRSRPRGWTLSVVEPPDSPEGG